MRIYNSTGLPQKPLYEAIAFGAKGIPDAGVVLRIKSRRHGYSGRCYTWRKGYQGQPLGYAPDRGDPIYPNVPRGTRCLITMHLGDAGDKWPTEFWNGYRLKGVEKRWPDGFPYDDWRDGVVALVAHEMRHYWQARRRWKHERLGKRASGKGELDAETHSLRVLNKWRIHTGREPIPEAKQPNPFAKS